MTSNTSRQNLLWHAGYAVLVALLLASLASPAGADDKKKHQQPAAPPVDISKLVWPAPPDVTRIRYVATVTSEDDVNPTPTKKKSSWMDKLAGVSLPQEEGKPRLQKPYGVAVDSKGIIYVADGASGRIFVFDLEKKKVSIRGANQLSSPAGLAIDDTDRLFVADAAQHAVFIFRDDGTLEGAFGQGWLHRPSGLAIDNENRFLYVCDSAENHVVVFDADTMKYLRVVGAPSDENALPGTFGNPTNVAVDSENNIYVSDTFNARVQVFDADGQFVRMWGKRGANPGNFMRPKGIAVDPDDHIYVVDSEFNNVQIFDTEGRILMFFGDRGETPGKFMLATGITVDKQNRVIVTEQWTGRTQIFQYVSEAEAKPEYEKQAQAKAGNAKPSAQ